MIKQADGSFTCPSGCPGRLVILLGAAKPSRGTKRFTGSRGDTFVLRTRASTSER